MAPYNTINSSFTPKKVFLTGANGFLGRAILKTLISENIPTVCYTRREFIHKNENQNVTSIIGELDDCKKIEMALHDCDSIVHCAGIIDFYDINHERLHFVHVEALKNLLKASKKTNIKRLLYVSSHWTIGFSLSKGDICSEKNTLNPDNKIYNVYQKTKLEGEQFLQKNADSIDYVIVNPSQIWGLGNKNELFCKFINKAKLKRLFIVPSGGLNVVHVNDVAKGITLALKFGKPSERYILGGENLTFKSLSLEFLRATGKKGFVIELPSSPIRFMVNLTFPILDTLLPDLSNKFNFLKTVATYKFYSSEKAKSQLGYNNSMHTNAMITELL